MSHFIIKPAISIRMQQNFYFVHLFFSFSFLMREWFNLLLLFFLVINNFIESTWACTSCLSASRIFRSGFVVLSVFHFSFFFVFNYVFRLMLQSMRMLQIRYKSIEWESGLWNEKSIYGFRIVSTSSNWLLVINPVTQVRMPFSLAFFGINFNLNP